MELKSSKRDPEEANIALWYRGKTWPYDGVDPITAAVLFGIDWKRKQYESLVETEMTNSFAATVYGEEMGETPLDKLMLAEAHMRGEQVGMVRGHLLGARDALETNKLCRDEYVKNVGTWKIIQRLEEQVERLERKNNHLIETIELSEEAFRYLSSKSVLWPFKLAFRDFALQCANKCRNILDAGKNENAV